MHDWAQPAHFMVMSIHSQHEQFVRDIRNGRARAEDLVGRYEPYTTSDGCVKHMFLDDDKCPDCARRARERNEDRQVDRYRDELWREQRDYDAEVARDQQAQAKKDQAKADRDARASKLWESNRKPAAPGTSGARGGSAGGSTAPSGTGSSRPGRPATRYSKTPGITLAEAKRRDRERRGL